MLSFIALPPKPELYAINAEYSKQADYAIACVIVLASKHQITSTKLKDLLIGNKIHATTVDQMIELYEKHKENLVFKLSHFGTSHNLPELTNVNWELTCDVEDSAELNCCSLLEIVNQLPLFGRGLGRGESKANQHSKSKDCSTYFLSSLTHAQRFAMNGSFFITNRSLRIYVFLTS